MIGIKKAYILGGIIASKLTNCENTNPNLTNLIPGTIIDGVDLGVDYDDGLDVSTDFGDSDNLPNIATKQQPTTWQKGAYLQD